MTPFAWKIVLVTVISILYAVGRRVFKDTMKGERAVPYLFYILFTPFIAYGCAIVLFYFVKVIYYMID